METNSAETFNSIVAKFVGGKRINFSLKNSYETRCKAAAISYNRKGNFIAATHQAIYGINPGDHTTLYYQRKKDHVKNVTKHKRNRNIVFATIDKDYGLEAETGPDMDVEFYEKIVQEFLKNLGSIDRCALSKATILQSQSDVWKSERKKRITASNFGKICKLRKTTSTAKTVAALLYSTFKGNSSTWFWFAK